MPIVWREQISVGNNVIDQDHKYLICLINSVELALKHEDTMEYLPTFVQQLVAYTRDHFTREEAIQKKALYPLIKEHKREHEEILAQIRERDRSGVGRRSQLQQTEGRLARAYASLVAQQNNLEDAATQSLRPSSISSSSSSRRAV